MSDGRSPGAERIVQAIPVVVGHRLPGQIEVLGEQPAVSARVTVDEPRGEPRCSLGQLRPLAYLGSREEALAQMHVAVRSAVGLERPPLPVARLGGGGAILLRPEVIV